MQLKKSLMIAAAVTTIGLGGLGVVGTASAATNTNGADSIIEKIATKFNLNKDDVKAVFDQEKVVHQAEHQAEVSERLQDLVDDGKITAEQKTLIENKQKEVQAARETERTDLEAWATDKGIDLKYVMGSKGDSDRLQNLVDDGKITAEQKTLIEQKQDELENKRESARDALEQWAEDNKIDQKYLMMGGRGHGGGPRGER